MFANRTPIGRVPLDTQLNKYTCEAHGCDAEATYKIEVGAGKFGKMTLHVCESCLSKFED